MDDEMLEIIEEKVREAVEAVLEDKMADLADEIAEELDGRLTDIIDAAVNDSIIEYFSEGIEEFLSGHQLVLKDGTTLQMRQKTRVMSPDTVIDPKGVIGDPVFDLSRFILDEFRDDLTSEPKDVIIHFVQKLGDSAGIPCEVLLRYLYIETVIWLFREELDEGESLEECEQLIRNMKAAYGFVMDIQKDITKM